MGVAYNSSVVSSGLVLALDAGNKKSYSQNYHPNSLDIYGWYVGIKGNAIANTSTLSRDTISSPVGNTPLKMVTTGNDSYLNSYNSSIWNLATAKSGQTWTVSVYAKADISTTGQIFIFEVNSSGNFIEAPAKTINITTNWQRFDYTYTFTNANTTNVQFRLDGADTFNGATIWWDGVQVERGSSATSFTSIYTGENILDICGRLNNGTLTNGPSYSGSNGGSLIFDHTMLQYLSFSNSPSLQFLNRSPYTLEAWVYPTRNPGDNNWTGIFDRESNAGSGRDGYNIYFLGSSGTNTYFTTERFVAGSAAAPSVTLNQSVSVNNWQHIAATYDDTTLSLYRNGVSVGTPATSTGNITNTSKALTIGLRGGQYFGGRISNAKIYNKALTAFEIQQNFNATKSRFGL